MARPSFFFYDLETSGLSSSDARIMQFAGQRTSLDLEPIGEPVNLLVRLSEDTLPSPAAILTTKITPQKTLEEGISEPELAKFLQTEVFTPDTIITGFNSVRFDDKFIQHLFWRNFYDPYEWMWKEGRSRWDLLDVVRMTRALRPEGINWPLTDDGKPTNRLELITKLNNISHESAHDALSDVNALIDVSRLVKAKQPKLFNYLFKLRDKREVKTVVSLDHPAPFVYSSGRYGSAVDFTTVAYPLFETKNGNILVYDLRRDPAEIEELFPAFKEFAFNRCPAVAPISVLDSGDGWGKLGLSRETIDQHLEALKSNTALLERARAEFTGAFEHPPVDAESSLYDGFLPDMDRARLVAVREKDADALADFHPNFTDERLPELLLHYKAKNFPTSLSETEEAQWQAYRTARLNRQAPTFLAELEQFRADPNVAQDSQKTFLLDELMLWYQALQD